MIKNKPKAKKIDKGLFFLAVGLTLFGVLMVYNASVAESLRDFQDKYHYLKYQLLWGAIGLGLMIVVANINYKFFRRLAPALFFLNIILLLLVLIPGIGVEIKGARRWLDLGFFVLQPTELIKLTLTLYLAAWLAKKRSFWHFLFILGLVSFLIILQPDLGTTVVVIASAFLIYYVSGASFMHLLPLALAGFLGGLVAILRSSYRRERLLTFLDPTKDPLGSSYHIRQVLIALGSGGFFGLGLGQSRQKYEYLPEATTDSIFAIIAEEIGFVGGFVLIFALFMVVYKGLIISKRAPDLFSQLTAAGISLWIGLQTLINLAAMVALIPLTGLPLPFISYGGSSLVVVLTSMGILLNISKYRVAKK
ncbi:putative lipid II flippase FtsW [Patescibacteria group bacterium]